MTSAETEVKAKCFGNPEESLLQAWRDLMAFELSLERPSGTSGKEWANEDHSIERDVEQAE